MQHRAVASEQGQRWLLSLFLTRVCVSVCAFATGAKAKLDLGKQAVNVAEEVVGID